MTEEYKGQEMVAFVMDIIKHNPLDDFWKEKNNWFLFEEIDEMCRISGYEFVLRKKGGIIGDRYNHK
jgi:hypothetical protein